MYVKPFKLIHYETNNIIHVNTKYRYILRYHVLIEIL